MLRLGYSFQVWFWSNWCSIYSWIVTSATFKRCRKPIGFQNVDIHFQVPCSTCHTLLYNGRFSTQTITRRSWRNAAITSVNDLVTQTADTRTFRPTHIWIHHVYLQRPLFRHWLLNKRILSENGRSNRHRFERTRYIKLNEPLYGHWPPQHLPR